MIAAHPILSCEQSAELESRLLGADELKIWQAMLAAGHGVAREIERDFLEIGGLPDNAALLVLAGKGHNAGDALIAARELLARHSHARADVVLVFGERALKPQALRAWKDLCAACPGRVTLRDPRTLSSNEAYDLCIDGIFGFQFHPPLGAAAQRVLRWAADLRIRLRAAVDLPSGLDAPGAFRADFSYATGIVKSPLLSCGNSGRLRYVDLGFFAAGNGLADSKVRDLVLTDAILAPLRVLRSPISDKRTFGHLFVLGGSLNYPGAVLMTVLAALRGGTGLVTVCVPRSLAPAFAARAPEAMWVGCPETPQGGIALESFTQIAQLLPRATAAVVGPGLGREPETLALATQLLKATSIPVVVDADALQASVLRGLKGPRILTPHAGEYLRIAGGLDLRTYARESKATVVFKGPVTQIAFSDTIVHSFFGGPMLARGGSGDILAGLIGAMLAQEPAHLPEAAARGVALHGRAADALARKHGQVAIATTDLLSFLSNALRDHDD